MNDLINFGPFILAVILEVVILFKWRGKWFWIALLLLLPLLLILAITISGFIQQSNLWPIIMILGSPLLLVLLFVLIILHHFLTTRQEGKDGRS